MMKNFTIFLCVANQSKGHRTSALPYPEKAIGLNSLRLGYNVADKSI